MLYLVLFLKFFLRGVDPGRELLGTQFPWQIYISYALKELFSVFYVNIASQSPPSVHCSSYPPVLNNIQLYHSCFKINGGERS